VLGGVLKVVESGEEYLSERSKSLNLVEEGAVVAAVVLGSVREEEKSERYLRELGEVAVLVA
jgi:hypothetical protein